MDRYRPPLDDILFCVCELAPLDAVLADADSDDLDRETIGEVLREAGRFFAERLAPLNAVGDHDGVALVDGLVRTPPGFAQVYGEMVAAGWPALPFDRSDGGQGFPALVNFAVVELMQSANLSFSMCPLLAVAAVDTLKRYAEPALLQRYLPALVSGRWSSTMALTESHAGSDLSGVRTMARRDGDCYRLRGQKIYISFGDHDMTENIVHLVLARVEGAPEGTRGLSLFLVPKLLSAADGDGYERNDVQVVSLEQKLGLHASPTCVLQFGDGDGAVGYLVGDENRGLACMFTMMNHARLQVGSQGLALTERAFQHALAYASDRRQGRGGDGRGPVAIVEHADVKRMLLMMKVGAQAMRALIYTSAALLDLAEGEGEAAERARQRLALLTPVVKGWCTEFTQELTGLAVQVSGGMGFILESGISQYLRDARITTIYEGTTGIQAGDFIHRKVLRDRGATMGLLLDELRSDLLESPRDPELGEELLQSAGRLADTLPVVLAMEGAAADAVAVPFLMLCGYVVAGWQLFRSASIDAGRVPALRFYNQYFLPRADQLARTVLDGGEALAQYPDELLREIA